MKLNTIFLPAALVAGVAMLAAPAARSDDSPRPPVPTETEQDTAPASDEDARKSGAEEQPEDERAQVMEFSVDEGLISEGEVRKVFGKSAAVIELDALSMDQIERMQFELHLFGHYRGKVDGIMGPRTRAALRAFLSSQHDLALALVGQNKLTDGNAVVLGLEMSEIEKVRGVDEPNKSKDQKGFEGGEKSKATSDKATSDKANSDKATSDKETSDEATSDEATSDEENPDKATPDKTEGKEIDEPKPIEPGLDWGVTPPHK